MTAEVAVLNKSCVVLAADSAVTVSSRNSSKVFNQANKVFSLSNKDHVGIMVFNNAEFMGVPIETIIKLYREQNDKHYDFLEQHAQAFFSWLANNKALFPDELQDTYANVEFIQYTNYILQENKQHEQNGKRILKNKLYDFIDNEVSRFDSVEFVEGINEQTKRDGLAHFELDTDKWINLIEQSLKTNISKEYKSKIKNIYLSLITKAWYTSGYTGIVISGFGQKDHFPKLIAKRTAGIFLNHLSCTLIDSVSINQTHSAELKLYAQSDMAQMFVTGVHPDFLSLVKHHSRFIRRIMGHFGSRLPADARQDLTHLVTRIYERFDEDIKSYITNNHESHINQMLDLMPKEQLAEFAESLINLTHIKQLVSTEQETVGGPVDIAVISRGDGLVWIKRKHYFSSELNTNYIAKLYNK